MKFTKRSVEAIEATGKRQVFFDDEYTGFALRVSPNGKKSFYYTYRVGKGRGAEKKWIMLGAFPVMTVEIAREKAKDTASAVQQGIDPAADLQEKKSALTTEDALDAFTKEYVDKLKPNTVAFYGNVIEKHLKPKLGRLRVNAFGYSDIAKLHTALKEKPYMANRCIAVLSVFLNWCEKHGYREKYTNPCKEISLYREHKRQEFMTEDDFSRLGDALNTLEANWRERQATNTRGPRDKQKKVDTITPQSAAAIRLLLFTGARLNEILSLKWEYIDMERGIATLPDSKTGLKPLVLSVPALAVLESLPEMSEWVFPANSKTGHQVNLKEAWGDVLKFASMKRWRLHDLRHGFASVMVNSGASLPIIGKILGHTQVSTTQRYAHLEQNPARKAAEDAAGRIAAALQKAPKKANVVRFQGAVGE